MLRTQKWIKATLQKVQEESHFFTLIVMKKINLSAVFVFATGVVWTSQPGIERHDRQSLINFPRIQEIAATESLLRPCAWTLRK